MHAQAWNRTDRSHGTRESFKKYISLRERIKLTEYQFGRIRKKPYSIK